MIPKSFTFCATFLTASGCHGSRNTSNRERWALHHGDHSGENQSASVLSSRPPCTLALQPRWTNCCMMKHRRIMSKGGTSHIQCQHASWTRMFGGNGSTAATVLGALDTLPFSSKRTLFFYWAVQRCFLFSNWFLKCLCKGHVASLKGRCEAEQAVKHPTRSDMSPTRAHEADIELARKEAHISGKFWEFSKNVWVVPVLHPVDIHSRYILAQQKKGAKELYASSNSVKMIYCRKSKKAVIWQNQQNVAGIPPSVSFST